MHYAWNPDFAYSDHKRQVEELLARARVEHPELRQLIFRPGAILGDTTRNQITDLFEKKVVLGVAGSDAPFTFIWDRDVVACLVKGIIEGASGIFNLAGDGMTRCPEIARRLGKRYVPVPAWLIRAALTVLHPLRLSQYGPAQVDFLRYRPVLSNTATEGSVRVFAAALEHRGVRALPQHPRPWLSISTSGGRSVVITGRRVASVARSRSGSLPRAPASRSSIAMSRASTCWPAGSTLSEPTRSSSRAM